MRLKMAELKGGFNTANLFYQSVNWLSKDTFGQARMTREITEGSILRKFEHGGHKFIMDAPDLTPEELDTVPGSKAAMGKMDEIKFEVLERVGDKMMIKADEQKPFGSLWHVLDFSGASLSAVFTS